MPKPQRPLAGAILVSEIPPSGHQLNASYHLVSDEVLEAVRAHQEAAAAAIALAAASGVTLKPPTVAHIARDLSLSRFWIISALRKLKETL